LAKTLASALKTEKNALNGIGQWVWLYQLQRDSSNTSYYVQANADVTFNSQTYTHKNITLEPIASDLMGTTPKFSVTIGDSAKTEIGYLRADKYRGQPCTIYLVNLQALSSASNKITFRGIILSADAEEGAVTLNCGSFDLRNVPIPRRLLFRNVCSFEFKGPCGECGYVGATTTCDKTLAVCTGLANQARYGGAPGIPILRP
jgi:hypothetical protein